MIKLVVFVIRFTLFWIRMDQDWKLGHVIGVMVVCLFLNQNLCLSWCLSDEGMRFLSFWNFGFCSCSLWKWRKMMNWCFVFRFGFAEVKGESGEWPIWRFVELERGRWSGWSMFMVWGWVFRRKSCGLVSKFFFFFFICAKKWRIFNVLWLYLLFAWLNFFFS